MKTLTTAGPSINPIPKEKFQNLVERNFPQEAS